MVKTTVWKNCYDESLKGLIDNRSMVHPAKMARGLAERIFDHGKAMGYWTTGDLILDPFSGIFTVGLVGAYRGYRVVGCELETKFVDLAQANIELNRRKLEMLGRPIPVIVQGDSRRLREHIAGAVGSITSPPYVSGGHHPDQTGSWGGLAAKKGLGTKDVTGYGQADGQIGQMQEGDHATVVGAISSPPYADQTLTGERNFKNRFNERPLAKDNAREGYGASDGQLGALKEGDHAAVVGAVTSPPFAGNSGGTGPVSSEPMNARYPGVFERHLGSIKGGKGYGASDGQINAMPEGNVEIVKGAISSPPFLEGRESPRHQSRVIGDQSVGGAFVHRKDVYGDTPGQVGAMPEGDVEAVKGAITSPPWAESIVPPLPTERQRATSSPKDHGGPGPEYLPYGESVGQLGRMSEGDHTEIVGAVTSPPYADSVNQNNGANDADPRTGLRFTYLVCDECIKSEELWAGNDIAKIATFQSAEVVDGADRVPENTLVQHSRDGQSQRNGKRESPPDTSMFPTQSLARKKRGTGRAVPTVGAGPHGESKDADALSAPITHAKNAEAPPNSSITSKTKMRPAANGTIVCPICWHSAAPVILAFTRDAESRFGLSADIAAHLSLPRQTLDWRTLFAEIQSVRLDAIRRNTPDGGRKSRRPIQHDRFSVLCVNQSSQEVPKSEGESALHSAQKSDGTTDVALIDQNSYWASVCVVYQELHALLPIGGVVAVVVKDYVRNGQIVPLCTQTAELLEAIGFRVIERIRAMLTKEIPQPVDMFTGESKARIKKSASFFRRLYEKKYPENAIDWEEVIFAQKVPVS